MIYTGNVTIKNKFFLKRLQGLCFCVIALNLLWALFADSALAVFFSVASFGMTAFTVISSVLGKNSRLTGSRLVLYTNLLIWFFIMIYVYGFVYSVHKDVSFFFITLDSYAMFFIRCIISIFPCMVFVHNNEFKLDLFIKFLIFIVLLVSVYYVSYAVVVNPNALRERATMEVMGEAEVLKYTPGYSMIYSYSLVFPVFLDKCLSNKGGKKAYYFTCCLMMLYMIFVAQFATALLMSIIGVFVYAYFKAKQSKRIMVAIIALTVAFGFLMTNGGTVLFHWLADKVPGTLSEKLDDIAETLSQDTAIGSVDSRRELYKESWQTFKIHPLFGMITSDSGSIGGHATLIDIMGIAGLFGAIPFVVCIYSNFTTIKRHTSYGRTKEAAIAVFVEFVILVLLKNIITSLAIFFVFFAFIPLLLKAED